MNVLDLIPEFKYMEVNNLTGLRTGQVLSQFANAAGLSDLAVTVGKAKYYENGIMVTLDKDATLIPFDSTKEGQPFVHFTEPLNTVVDKLSAFAVPSDKILRCVGLYLGDTFTTNNVAEGNCNDESREKPFDPAKVKAAKVVAGKITLENAATADSIFAAVGTTMPNGDLGVELTYVGKHEIA